MANDMGTEQVAERFLRIKGIKKPDKPVATAAPSRESPQANNQLVSEAYDLLVEKEDLRRNIVGKQRGVMEPTSGVPLTLDQKRELIRQGEAGFLLSSVRAEPFKEVVGRSQARINEIDERMDQIFQPPGAFEKFRGDLSRQVRVRRQARGVRSLDRFAEQTDLLALRLTREAQIQGRSLTSAERGIIQDNRMLKQEALQKKQELLDDPEVFDRTRLLELKEYKRQLQYYGYAETPSRTKLIEKIEDAWRNGEKVLLTGHTGTGKTQVYAHASRKLFEEDPEVIPGNEDIGYYQIVGATGFENDKDVPRSGSLVQAMIGRKGRGKPWLIDEITRIPGRQIASAKWLFGIRPGANNIKPYPNQPLTVDVGVDYCGGATANIKNEAHGYQVYELDPAITREFTQPVRVDYMPPYEVYDLALAMLMDHRGGIALSETETRTFLKNLCDAAGATQQGFQGKKIIVGDTVIEDRRDASTGKIPSLKKAVLDPGWILKIVKGWSGAMGKGVTFESYLQERILEHINNEDYPDDDRYYLTRIFALKNLLNGRTANEFFVSGLTDSLLSTWSGGKAGKKSKSQDAVNVSNYLSPDRVVRLDPYRKFKKPVSADAEDLLPEEVQGAERERKTGEDPMANEAKRILGSDFFGVEAIKKAFGMELDPDTAIPLIPFSKERLEQAKRQNQFLILRIGELGEQPLTMARMRILLQSELDKLGKGKVLYSDEWYKNEAFFKSEPLKPAWALVSKEPIPDSTNTNYLQQTEALVAYLVSIFGKAIPASYRDAISEFEKQKKDIGRILYSNWQEAAEKLSDLKINQMGRHNPAETLYDGMIYFQNTGDRWLANFYTWTNSRSSDGYLVFVGLSASNGVLVHYWPPDPSHPSLGLYASLVD